jgi:L-iduronidase
MATNLHVNFGDVVAPLHHFWESTGFTPARLLLRPDMRQTLDYVASVPRWGMKHVRMHYLLDLVRGGESGSWDWSELDEALDVLVARRLKPFFELMGRPGGRLFDFRDQEQLLEWRGLVATLAEHLMARYGRDEVRSWYFETWNEPDAHDTSVDVFHGDVACLCAYYDACCAGLWSVDERLRMGGPGTCITLSPFFKGFLTHCADGRSRLAGRKVRIDFISAHIKGATMHPEDIQPSTMGIVADQRRVIDYIRSNHPSLAHVELMNNECDPQIGWCDVHTWHGRPYYASQIVRCIDAHIREIIDGCKGNFTLLSNDNGFVGSWGNRTQLARLPSNGTTIPHQRSSQTIAPEAPFALIKKPALNVMGMLSMLGQSRCAVEGAQWDERVTVGAIASRTGDDEVAVLVHCGTDRIMSGGKCRVRLDLQGVPFEQAAMVQYVIDEDHTGDPFRVWERGNVNAAPSADELAALRAAHELCALRPRRVACAGGKLRVTLEMPLQSVAMVVLARQPAEGPAVPADLRARAYAAIGGGTDVMLLWRGPGRPDAAGRHIRTYEVQASIGGSPQERLSPDGLVFTGFLHAAADASARYRVRAVDFWGRKSEFCGDVGVE